MTGFARVRRAMEAGDLVVAVKSVNHRGLDIQVHAPSAVDAWEAAIRTQVKSRVARGHVEVRVSLPQAAAGGFSLALNKALLQQYISAFHEAAAAHELDGEPDLNFAFRLPGMLSEPGETEAPAGCEAALVEALAEALEQLNQFRAREGAEIAAELRGHNARVQAAADEMERIRSTAIVSFQRRLNDRLSDLLAGVGIEPQRLAQEVAVLVDRSDVGEEIARLRIHSVQLAALLDAGGETGKRLDFLLQEMNRETNTILSKTSGVGELGLRITELALDTKAAIEKIREQSLNLE
jgi:uncharacterized protein (TIGR00255 family)